MIKNNKPLSIWMSEEEKRLVKKKAEKDKRSVSNYVRKQLFGDEE